MRSFSFRLEPILTVRAYKAKQAEIELARVTGECLAVEREIQEIGAKRDETYRMLVPAGDLSYRVAQGRHIQFLEHRMDELRRRRSALEPKRLEAQSLYNELSKDEKVLDKLKERRSNEYYREYRKLEGRVSDESAGQIHTMRKRERRSYLEGDE